MTKRGVELAPAAIVRVAGWPLGVVGTLAVPELATHAAAADEHGAGWTDYSAAYTSAIAAQRRSLWRRTAKDRRFVTALALVNPALAKTLVGRPLAAKRNKAARHLETTLYRYLARAVCRTEPCGLWTGVTLARWGRRRRTRRVESPRCQVAPDLAVFRTVATALAQQAPYPDESDYKLNPTLKRDEDGYAFWSDPARGPSTLRRLRASAVVARAIAALQRCTPCTRSRAVVALAADGGIEPETARAIAVKFSDAGVLVGGLVFPRAFRDPWEALSEMERRLRPDHAGAWRRARLRLRSLAGHVLDGVRRSHASTVIDAMDAAGLEVERLASALGIEALAKPRAPLRCDAAAPWSIELGCDDADVLERALLSYTSYDNEDGLRDPLTRAAIKQMLKAGAPTDLVDVLPARVAPAHDGLVTWERLATESGDPDVVARVERRHRMLEHPGPERWIRPSGGLAGPPLAVLHFALGDASVGHNVIVHGMGVDATAAYARVAPLLESGGQDCLTRWFRVRHWELADRTGVDRVALTYDHAIPNVLARPDLGVECLDPWGVESGQRLDASLDGAIDPALGWPTVRLTGRVRPVVVFAPTAAAVAATDPCAHALLLSTGRMPPLCPANTRLASASELERPRHAPRLRLDDGCVVKRRRTFVLGAELELLTRATGAKRFARWQRLAQRKGWPALVLVQRDRHPALLVPRDSPLAVEAAFEGARRSPFVHVEEFASDAWIGACDENDDRRYVADLVLPFVRDLDRGASSRRRDALAAAQRRPGPEARPVAGQ